ncbi:MAG: carboxypeptidase-like regulatory domain-containing protein [Chitinophagaceae bacterium]
MQKNKHIIYTAADIAKYHKGLMPGKARNALEKAALDDPFLADALEGYAIPSLDSDNDIAELKKRLSDRIEQNKEKPLAPVLRSSFSWWKVAAVVILVFGAGFLVYQFGLNNKHEEIAANNKKEPAHAEETTQNISKPDSPLISNADIISSDAAISQRSKDSGLKKTDRPSALISPNETTTNGLAEFKTGKNDASISLTDTTIQAPGATQFSTDDKAKETTKSLRNDNAVDKSKILEKSYDYKTKDFSLKKKVDADDVPGLQEGYAAKSSASNTISKQQGVNQHNQTNVFRGRVTDANSNAIPFSNVTNLQDNIGTYSDARGYFNLTSPDSVLNVQVRSLGFESNSVQLQNKLPENKILMEEDRSLSATILDTVKRNTNRSRNTTMVLEEPEPVDGWSNYDMYLVNNLKVPESFRIKQPGGGEVELSFEVDKNGEPVNITIRKSLCESCDKEAIRLIREGPKWKRKIKKGKATVTVAF